MVLYYYSTRFKINVIPHLDDFRYIHEMLKYEFEVEFDVPVTYPTTSPEIALPELDGKTAKMYRGGKICLTDHFKPLWAKNVPKV